MYIRSEDVFADFFDKRSSLIVQYQDGELSKKEFLVNNYNFVRAMRMKPFLKIDSYEKGMYNYQYYNVLAKYYKMLAKEVRGTKRHNRHYNYYKNKSNNYYNEKDKAALDILKFIKFKNVEAYFVKANSTFLKNKLYEIVLLDYKEAIFHSLSLWLLEELRKAGIFQETEKTSLIDGYINTEY